MKRILLLGMKGIAVLVLLVCSLAFTLLPPEEYLGECGYDEDHDTYYCGVGCAGPCDCNWNAQCYPQ